MKKLISLMAVVFAFSMSLSQGAYAAAHTGGASADCAAKSAEKKLAGAAKNSFEKKCMADAGGGAMTASAACEKSSADKKLAGAAKNSHMKKCMADEKAGSKPMADAKPTAATKPMAAASAAKK